MGKIIGKRGYGLAMFGVLCIGCQLVALRGWQISWQTTDSLPRGWYLFSPPHSIVVGDLVVFPVAPIVRGQEQWSNWLSYELPLVKQVVATAGMPVCWQNGNLHVNTQTIDFEYIDGGTYYPFCRTLNWDELYVINQQQNKSFDSRYFGPVSMRHVLHKAVKL